MNVITEADILDTLCMAVKGYKVYGRRGLDWAFDALSDRERIAFDLFLVRTKDPLAWIPGTVEARFKARVLAMALNRPATLNDAPNLSEA